MGSIHIMKLPPISLQKTLKNNRNNSKQIHIEAILNKVVEGINIIVVCEFVAAGRKILQALNHNTHDIEC